MAEKTLTDLSPNGSQDANTVILNKTDLGLTGATNTLDQIFAAIIMKGKEVLTQENYDAEAEQKVYVTDGILGRSFTPKNNVSHIQDTFTVSLVKPDPNTTLSPMDY